MADDPHGAPDGDRTVDPANPSRPRRRAGLRPPWPKGQSGNPKGRSKQAAWFKLWCQRLLAGDGLEAFALKVKQGDMVAIRLALAYAYGPPPAEVDGPADDSPAASSTSDPQSTTRDDELENIWLEGAQDDIDHRMRRRAIGLTDKAFDRIVEADRRARENA
jgi:hypothetical protein